MGTGKTKTREYQASGSRAWTTRAALFLFGVIDKGLRRNGPLLPTAKMLTTNLDDQCWRLQF